MAHIGSGVEYSLHCLLYLVGRGDGPAPSARDLAEYQGISASSVAKLFTKLEKAGLVSGAEGVRGGFRLAKPAAQISVLAVVDAIEGGKPLFDCKEIRAYCSHGETKPPPAELTSGVCGIHAVMLEADQEMRQVLAAHTLASIAKGLVTKIPATHRQATLDWFAERANGRAPGRHPTPTTETH